MKKKSTKDNDETGKLNGTVKKKQKIPIQKNLDEPGIITHYTTPTNQPKEKNIETEPNPTS